MECWCRVVLLVVSLAVLMGNGAKADAENFDNHVCTQFSRFDANGDLVLELEDFENAILATAPNGTVFTMEQLRSAATLVATSVPLASKATLDKIFKCGLSLEDYLTSMRKRRFKATLAKAIEDMIVFIFQSFNSDGNDTVLTFPEYAEIFKYFGVAESEVPAAFNDVDLNGNGIVELQECTEIAMIYYNEAPLNDRSNSFSGPIRTCLEVAKNDTSNLP